MIQTLKAEYNKEADDLKITCCMDAQAVAKVVDALLDLPGAEEALYELQMQDVISMADYDRVEPVEHGQNKSLHE